MAYKDVITLLLQTYNIKYENVPDSSSPASQNTATYYN
jgi:hypothetical protein